jgi:hypothetical protein
MVALPLLLLGTILLSGTKSIAQTHINTTATAGSTPLPLLAGGLWLQETSQDTSDPQYNTQKTNIFIDTHHEHPTPTTTIDTTPTTPTPNQP